MRIQLRLLVCVAMFVVFVSAPVFHISAAGPGAVSGNQDDANAAESAALALTTYASPSVPFGIQMDVGLASGATGYQLAAAAGALFAKTGVSWAAVEPNNTTPANYNWGSADARLQNAVDAGLELLVSVTSNPSWAASTSCGPIDLVPVSEFAEFLTALVNRYSQPPYNVKYWELFNEADIKDPQRGADYGGCWGNDGAAYAQMLAAADAAIHAADPEAKILVSSLAYEWWSGDFFNSGIDPTISPGPTEWSTSGNEFPDFLETVLNNGGGDHFDVMSFHDYVVFHPRWDRPDDGSLSGNEPYAGCAGRPQEGDILGKLIYLRKRLMTHNPTYGDKPFAVTEMGRRSDSGQKMLQQSCLGGPVPGSDEQQSRYAVQGNVRSMAAGLELAIWFNLVDFGGKGYGLLDTYLNPKPAYWAYKTTTSELDGYHYVKQLPAAETGGYTDVEAYLFENDAGNKKWVLWTPTKLSGETTRQVSFPTDRIRMVPKQKYNDAHPDEEIPGVVQIIGDGEAGDLDGAVNGQVAVNITASPVFVQDFSTLAHCLSKPSGLDPVAGGGINLDDILAVAGAWREEGVPGTPHPFDYNGNDSVDVGDILHVAQWFGCP